MSDAVRNVLDCMDPQVVLDALHGALGSKSPEADLANERIAKALEKSGVDCGPQGCRSGFIQRKLLTYAGENMLRELHQRVAQNATKDPV